MRTIDLTLRTMLRVQSSNRYEGLPYCPWAVFRLGIPSFGNGTQKQEFPKSMDDYQVPDPEETKEAPQSVEIVPMVTLTKHQPFTYILHNKQHVGHHDPGLSGRLLYTAHRMVYTTFLIWLNTFFLACTRQWQATPHHWRPS